MSRKSIQWIVVFVILAFGLTIIAYPLLFSPKDIPEEGEPVNIEDTQ